MGPIVQQHYCSVIDKEYFEMEEEGAFITCWYKWFMGSFGLWIGFVDIVKTLMSFLTSAHVSHFTKL